jgi:hypothetical protein
MPSGNLDGGQKTPIAARARVPHRASGTLPPESANAGYHGIYDSRGIYTRLTNGLVGLYSMTRRHFGLAGRLPTCGGSHCGREPEAEIGPYPQAAPSPRRAVPVHFDFRAKFIVQHCEREIGPFSSHAGRGGGDGACLRRVSGLHCVSCDSGGKQIRGPGGILGREIHARIHHACTRLPRLRKKYNTHEQIPSPRVGHSCGASPSPHITPIAGPFPGDIHTWAYVPDPLTGDIGRGPGTCAHSPGRTPPNSHEKSAPTRCVVGWVESGYVERGAHDTRHLSSCLVTSSGISGQIRGGSGGR